jgi:peroxiredoxin Q/BCP
VDSVKSHEKFIEEVSLPFSLIADEDKEIVDKYNLWGQKKFMGLVPIWEPLELLFN